MFFDTPDLTLFSNGVVVRARRTQRADDDTVPEGLPNRSTIEQWHYPGRAHRAVDKATPQNVLQVLADGVRFVREHGLSATGAQEPKTRKALEFFARAHPAR